jgi:biopolymer transport protein ExbD
MKRINQESSTTEMVEINLSPMIDCVFLLLIFFIVTTVFAKETGVKIQKPHASTASHLNKQSLMIALTANGKIIYGGQELNINSVRGLVARQLNAHNSTVIIMADRNSSTGKLLELMDECKRGGATSVSVAASRKEF